MNLIIDIGNTFTKIFIFKKNKLFHTQQISGHLSENIKSILESNTEIKHIIISSVDDSKQLNLDPNDYKIETFIIFDHSTPIPIKNLYESPETLGKDRLAAAIGAYNIFPGKNVLAIDAGTAIKYDFINSDGEYLGGNISPGLTMRYKALNHFTNKLPLLEPAEENNLIGKNTTEAIIGGVQNGMIFEIDSYIASFRVKFVDLKVILCGGDTFFFARKLKNRIFAEPYLVALGLNRILQDNVKSI